MSHFFESIRLENGFFYNLDFHSERLNKTRKTFFQNQDDVNLKEILAVPAGYQKGLFKCKITYSSDLTETVYEPYQVKKIKKLKLVFCDEVEYGFKSTDRSVMDRLFSMRENADDVLIVKNELITDISIANVCFYDGKKWVTPHLPLLKGTMRESLLQSGKIFESEIRAEEIEKYSSIAVINAMRPFEGIITDKIKIIR